LFARDSVDNFKTLTEWSAAVRARDGCCRRCGATVALVAHHIKAKSRFPELRLCLGNGETLCSNCHTEHHRAEHLTPKGERDAERKAARRTKLALLRAENSALKSEIEAMRRERISEIADRSEIARLRAELAEYEAAYAALTSWQQ
jgi:hypothetical protein